MKIKHDEVSGNGSKVHENKTAHGKSESKKKTKYKKLN